jgi:hypothetical protein
MPANPPNTRLKLSQRFLVDDEARVREALRRAVRSALVEHARLGYRVATWRHGVVEIDATDVQDSAADAPDGS